MASGSQTNRGICALLPVAARKISRVIAVTAPPPAASLTLAASFTAAISSVPKMVKMASVATMNPKSPIRLTTKAFLAAEAAEFFLK